MRMIDVEFQIVWVTSSREAKGAQSVQHTKRSEWSGW